MTLKPWMRIGQPLENVLQDYERVLDAWDAGGIRGLVFGRLVFADAQGEFTIPAFPGKIAAYEVSLDGTPTEVRILILGNDDSFFAICLVTPPREKIPGAWLVNQRAFEIAGMRVRSADGE